MSPDARLIEQAEAFRRSAVHVRGKQRTRLRDTADRIEQIAQAHAELGVAFASKVDELARLRWGIK